MSKTKCGLIILNRFRTFNLANFSYKYEILSLVVFYDAETYLKGFFKIQTLTELKGKKRFSY